MDSMDENNAERLKFVDLWSRYVLEHDDKEWSRQQNVIINSCLKNSSMTKEQFMILKGEDA